MCELPKYENRSWATSCHKPAMRSESTPATTPQAKPVFHTSRHYRYLQAQNRTPLTVEAR
ncbi:MAG: hypothetical protein WBF35_08520 [Candidatus Acidiferrales bacterium]